jgi:iron complex outermembrane recepter protein
MKTKFLLFFAFIFYTSLNAQTISYNGIVQDQQTNSNEYIILLTDSSNASIRFSEVTINKKFIFSNIPSGNYNRCIVYDETKQCESVLLNNDILNDSIIIEKTEKLTEVVITSKKKLIENKSGTLTVNVQNSPVMSSGTVFEMLSKLPGISYNMASNSFRLKGKEGIQIQIDGQTLYLSGNELSEYLKNISADDISAVEINSSPSSHHDASGNAGIINIKTKKIKREGIYTGISFNTTQGKYYKQDASLKIQYNTKKNSYVLHYNNAFNTDFEKAYTNRTFENSLTNQNTYAKIKGNTNTINSQFEHEFKKSNLLFISTISFYKENIIQNTNLDFYSNNTRDSTLISKQQSSNKIKDYTFGINYVINQQKSKLTLKTHYIHYNINNQSNLSSYSITSNYNYGNLLNKSPNGINIFLNQLDYEHKIDSTAAIEFGAKTVFQKIQNENNFYDFKSNQEVFDVLKSNDYKYNEWVIGGYLQYKKTLKKFDFTFGSRIEYNLSKGTNNKNNYTLNRDKTNFFPYLNIAYNVSETNNFNFSYSKRINRPSFSDLMPFSYYVDPSTKLLGNPNLNSFISHQLEFQYILKQNYIFAIDYSIKENEIFQTPIQDNQTLSTILVPENIKRGNSLSLSSNLTFDLFKWWNLNCNGVLFYDTVKSENSNLNINSSNWSSQLTATNLFNLPKNIKFELTADYISPFIQGPYKTNYLFSLNTSVSKSFLDSKLKIAIVGNDILGTYQIKNTSIIQNQTSNIVQKLDTKWIRLSIVYKFNKGIKKENTESDKLSEEIKSRVK